MPRVSIGLPVYNGENFVGAAVESLLAQTFTDFDLVIVDNASTDGTTEICRSFAARDARVRYLRNDRNIGGGPNLNRAFELACTGEYFKLAAHDDLHAPTFLERCVEALDRDPGAVLAFSKVDLIGPDGETIKRREVKKPLDSPDVLVRFDTLLPSYDCLDIYGVIRRRALRGNPIIGLHPDADGLLLIRLALQGYFIEVPEVLFFNRRHPVQAGSQFTRDHRAWAIWWNPVNANRRVFPQWRRQTELWRAVLQAPLSPSDRLRVTLALARWTRWKRDNLFKDVAFQVKDFLRSHGIASKAGDAEGAS